MKRFAILILLMLLLSACSAESAPSDGTEATPQVASPTTVPETSTATETPMPATATVPATAPALAPTATPNALLEALIDGVEPQILETSVSPDGAWRAEVVRYNCTDMGEEGEVAYEQLKIVNETTGSEQIADAQLQNCGGLGASGLGALFWSASGRFFYYTPAREGFPDGCGFWQRPLNRLQLETLQAQSLGAGPLSPDASKVATWQDGELVIWDVEGGELLRLPATAPDLPRGPITWSPDNQSLVYLQVSSFCPLSGASYVVQVDVAAGEQTVLVESTESPTFGGATWAKDDELTLFDETGDEWQYRFGLDEPLQND